MGGAFSILRSLRLAAQSVFELSKQYDVVRKRIAAGPGLPVANPTKPFWHDIPSPIATYKPEKLPEYADVVIIGSGITGASIARTLMAEGGPELKVLMLEARDACSGATGRNGGHIFPPLHDDYAEIKAKFGAAEAAKLTRLRLQHIQELIAVAKEEGAAETSQAREVRGLDVYLAPEPYEEAKARFEAWKAEMPEEAQGVFCVEGKDAIEKYRLSSHVAGVISNPAGAIHPYRFVTTILARLLTEYKGQFELATNTPCTSIDHASPEALYAVTTPFGVVRTPHVVHATNAWASNLFPVLRERIIALRATMTAQRPGTALAPSTLDGGRSWIFYDAHAAYDYLTQLPGGEHEMMFGGGLGVVGDATFDEVGTADDARVARSIAAHLSGALPVLFGEENWGKEAEPVDERWLPGRVKAVWSGIVGMSADEIPWVGRVPVQFAERSAPRRADNAKLAPPGEWICAGYTGEGMGYAFLCGRALAHQVLNSDADIESWFPECMGVTEKRWKAANLEALFEKYM